MAEDLQKQEFIGGNMSEKERYITACGCIKVLFLGTSNSGKTTLINGLIGDDILPECMCTSTKMTTYIGGSEDNINCISLFELNSDRALEKLNWDDFVKYSSYRLEEIHSATKSIESTKLAIIHSKHALSDLGICLVDTIGFGINQFDSEATIKLVDEADILVIVYDVSHTGGFTLDELNFLKKHIFKEKENMFPLDRIIIVPNKIDKVASVSEVVEIAKKDLCNWVESNTPEWNMLVNSICPISAYYYRLARVGISNHIIAGNRKIRYELMNYDAETLINASLETGNYKQTLFNKSKVGTLLELLTKKSFKYRMKK